MRTHGMGHELGILFLLWFIVWGSAKFFFLLTIWSVIIPFKIIWFFVTLPGKIGAATSTVVVAKPVQYRVVTSKKIGGQQVIFVEKTAPAAPTAPARHHSIAAALQSLKGSPGALPNTGGIAPPAPTKAAVLAHSRNTADCFMFLKKMGANDVRAAQLVAETYAAFPGADINKLCSEAIRRYK